ncbi:MAG: hypothetical protein RBR09_06205 [Desulfobulbaceae bacterium]|jgi:hypothetical protein|nr:hypothetical protein [Desulfobulbaceae bacterium]
MTTTRKCLLLLLLGALLSGLFHFQIVRKAVVDLSVRTDARTTLKIYWVQEGEPFTEKRMARIVLKPGRQHYSLRIGDLARIDSIRIDPSDEKPAQVTLKEVRIGQQGYSPITLQGREDLAQLEVLEDVEEVILEEEGITIVPAGTDPQLLFSLPPLSPKPDILSEVPRIIFIFLLVLCLAFLPSSVFAGYNYIPYLIVVVVTLAAVMAFISKNNMHPDEYVHVAAAEYYQDHNLPPRIGSPEISNTYSVYGVSRLHSGEIVYLIAGKFMKILEPFHFDPYLTLRLFNLLLLAGLMVFAMGSSDFRLMALPLLISPQIWYVFSYFNSDGFALFIALLAGYQLAVPNSMFHGYVANRSGGRTFPYAVALGFLFALLLLLKQNYYFFYLYLFLYFVWKVIFEKFPLHKENIVRIGVIAVIGVSLFGIFRVVDYAVNDFEKEQKLLEARENFAHELFKPSTPLQRKHAHLQMKERGTTLKYFIQIDRWPEKSFWTSFGVYGYTAITAQYAYYDLVRICGVLFMGIIIVWICARGGLSGNTLLGISLFSSLVLVAAALYLAWTDNFQAQGRYFLPIIAIFSILLYKTERLLPRTLFQPLLITMFILSVYSFVFVGLYDVAMYANCL